MKKTGNAATYWIGMSSSLGADPVGTPWVQTWCSIEAYIKGDGYGDGDGESMADPLAFMDDGMGYWLCWLK